MAMTRLGGSCLAGGLTRTMHEVCASCGATFDRHAEHAWRLNFKGKPKWYCSYTCMRRDERPRLEEARMRGKKKTEERREKTKLECALEKVERCRTRYEQAQGKRRDAKAWAAMTKQERKNASNTANYWLERLTMAEQELEDMRKRREGE